LFGKGESEKGKEVMRETRLKRRKHMGKGPDACFRLGTDTRRA
jgi:hypothetical protein